MTDEKQIDARINVVVAIPDNEYDRLYEAVKSARSKELPVKDKNGIEHIFYIDNRELKARKLVNDKWDDFEVMKMSDAMKKKEEMSKNSPFKDHLKSKMKQDHPEWDDDRLEAQVDIVNEANETIKRLISKGVEAKLAYQMVAGVMYNDEVKEHIISTLQQKVSE